MKKLLFLLLGMAVAIGANAGVTRQLATTQKKADIGFVTKRVAPPVQYGFFAPVTEQPAGELKTYQRSGKALWRTSSGLATGNQSGVTNIVFGDNNKVYFEDLLYGFYGGYWTPPHAWTEGTLSADGTTITVPIGPDAQSSIYYSDYWYADIILVWGTSAVSGTSVGFTADETVAEAVFAVDGNKITLLNSGGTPDAAYAAYEGTGLSCYWSDDQTWGYCINWDTEFTFVIPATVPENLTATPAVTSAAIAWYDNDDAAWNLRYRLNDPNNTLWDFEEEQASDNSLPGGWTTIDADGDGYEWYHLNTDGEWNCHSGAGHVTSASYASTALNPDNWLVSPQAKLFGKLQFWACAQDPEWPDEKFAVYVSTGDPTDVNSFVKISNDIIAVGTPTEYTFDLSEYNGQMGYIAIRHFDCSDNFRLNIDDVYIGNPWIYAENLENTNYTIEGLAPETTYDVQVQAFNEDTESEWTDIVEFTTIPNVYMLGGNDQGWDPTQGTLFTYDAENDVYTLTYTFPAEYNYFGFTKVLAENNDDGGWAYIEPWRFGAIADEGTDYWYSGEEDYVSLTWDAYHAIRIAGGEYKLTVDLNEMKLYIEKVEPVGLKGDVNEDGLVNVTDVTLLISAVVNENYEGINFYNGDMNDDGVLTVTDVTMLISAAMAN